ncbi:hypothetical protein BVRB_1g014160 [Beta vulgaris subsp. vulgaris]|nr:hypothetical protein BVRB_1g014160 [Beta vulgaris subsp. vulgaris]
MASSRISMIPCFKLIALSPRNHNSGLSHKAKNAPQNACKTHTGNKAVPNPE